MKLRIHCPEFRKVVKKTGDTFNLEKDYWKFNWHDAAYHFKYCPFCGMKLPRKNGGRAVT